MIYSLIKENLNKLGLENSLVEEILELKSLHFYRGFTGGHFFVDPVEGKFYTGRDFYFRTDKIEFPVHELVLIPDYFELIWNKFLDDYKTDSGGLPVSETMLRQRFRQDEITKTETIISGLRNIESRVNRPIHTKTVKPYQIYLDWLNSPVQPMKTEISGTELYEHYDSSIFSNAKGYELFDKLIQQRPKSRYKDFCVFVIKQLVEDKFMLDVKEHNYKDFIYRNYEIELDKFKALTTLINHTRMALYNTVKGGIQ